MSQPAITFDTNRLLYPTQRRFNAAWLESTNGYVPVLPRVAAELTHHRFEFEPFDPDHFREDMAGAAKRLDHTRNQLTNDQVMAREADLWWGAQLAREPGAYRLVRLSPEQYERVSQLARAIPADYFPKTPAEDVPASNDMQIIAQALVTGHRFLLTGNMHSIQHERINDWTVKHQSAFGLPHADILKDQDAAMIRSHRSDKAVNDLTVIALAAAWPGDPNASRADVETSLRGFLKAMEGARLNDTATIIGDNWRRSRNPERLLQLARENLPARMRQAETEHPAYPGTRKRAIDRPMQGQDS